MARAPAPAKSSRWERRPDERPQELLEAALVVFARKGYRGTRLEEVAEAAGVTKGTIYHYFDTKENLLLGVIQHYQSIAFGRVEDVLHDRAMPSAARIRLLVERLFQRSPDKGAPLLAVLIRMIAHEVPAVHARWLREGPVRVWTLIAEMVEEGKSRGEFRAGADGEAAARTLVSGLMVQLMWQQHADDVPELRIDEQRLIAASVDVFLTGLA
ncbi:MAG: TetR/AcrR family transcriptional regulator [Gemmatimonadaceae bacterium]